MTAWVYVFAGVGRFRSEEALEMYAEWPDGLAREIGLGEIDEYGIAWNWEEVPVPLGDLLRDAPLAEQWLHRIDGQRLADSAVCVYGCRQTHPGGAGEVWNDTDTPRAATLDSVGVFELSGSVGRFLLYDSIME